MKHKIVIINEAFASWYLHFLIFKYILYYRIYIKILNNTMYYA